MFGNPDAQAPGQGDVMGCDMQEHTRALQDFSLQYGEPMGDLALRRVLSGSLEPCTERWSIYDCLARLGVQQEGYALGLVPNVAVRRTERAAHGRFPARSGGHSAVDVSSTPYCDETARTL